MTVFAVTLVATEGGLLSVQQKWKLPPSKLSPPFISFSQCSSPHPLPRTRERKKKLFKTLVNIAHRSLPLLIFNWKYESMIQRAWSCENPMHRWVRRLRTPVHLGFNHSGIKNVFKNSDLRSASALTKPVLIFLLLLDFLFNSLWLRYYTRINIGDFSEFLVCHLRYYILEGRNRKKDGLQHPHSITFSCGHGRRCSTQTLE